MVRDRVIWAVCIGLFLTGGIFFRIFPESSSISTLGVVEWFSILSAIATAIAAIAAWKAASIARKQSFDTALTTRWQMHKMHLESFYEWLNGIESDQGVTFYRRQELYDSMFPSNRDPSLAFSEKGSDEVVAWQRSLDRLADLACNPTMIGSRQVEHWVGDYAMLTGYIKYSLLKPGQKQFYLDDRLPSGVSIDNYEIILSVMSNVMFRLSKFAFLEARHGYRGMTNEFKYSFKEFFSDVVHKNYNQHTYREDP